MSLSLVCIPSFELVAQGGAVSRVEDIDLLGPQSATPFIRELLPSEAARHVARDRQNRGALMDT
jgi:hypothetical protein